jgi:hypothetical protein
MPTVLLTEAMGKIRSKCVMALLVPMRKAQDQAVQRRALFDLTRQAARRQDG